MLAKRIIPCLDVTAGRVVKGVNFVNLRDAGDPVELAARYNEQGADELVFLDITASSDDRDTMVDVVARTAREVFIPLTVGGGIRVRGRCAADSSRGADKVSVNTAAVRRAELISELSAEFGAQAVVLAIDARRQAGPAERAWNVLHPRMARDDEGDRRGRMGPARRGSGRGRDSADFDGHRRRADRFRLPADGGGSRGHQYSRDRLRGRGQARGFPGSLAKARAPMPLWRLRSSITAPIRSAISRISLAQRGVPVRS